MLCFSVFGETFAQNAAPSANPTMYVVEANGEGSEMTSFDGSAPIFVTFSANVQDEGEYTPRFEWRFTRQGESEPFLVRYDEETEYTFQESGAFEIALLVSFVLGTDTLEYEQDAPFVITISESKLEVPNAFTP
ncbi:MAG: gliding motility-associated C-terminal domain-containing protein, partial [Bacteroidaceae bacterium]|nr:gliding motility-associated C-terminal domain-containing protein [Bacteroidaceae bacterium]